MPIVIVPVDNAVEVADGLPVELAETVAILVSVEIAERSWKNCGTNNAVGLDKLAPVEVERGGVR